MSVYNGEVEVEQAALAPLAVLAFRLGLVELVDSCTNAFMKQCVTFPYLLIVKCLVSDLYQTSIVRKANYSNN